MTDVAELEKLSTKELHDRAVSAAERRLDVGFLWRLAKAIPIAEAAMGDLREAESHVAIGRLLPLLRDWEHAGEGQLGEALRPMYVEYLAEHD